MKYIAYGSNMVKAQMAFRCPGAKLIGNIKIGTGAKIGAGSVVLDDVEPHTTVVGVPARPVASDIEDVPAREMNQKF